MDSCRDSFTFTGTRAIYAMQRGVVLDGHILLAAEAAAHQHILDLAVVIVHPQHGGALVHGWCARSGPRSAGGTPPFSSGQGHAALRLQEGVLRPGGVEVLGSAHILHVLMALVCVAAGDVLIAPATLFSPAHRMTRGASGAAASWGLCTAGRTSYSTFTSFLAVSRVSWSRAQIEGHGVAQIVGDLAHADQGGLVLFQVADVDLAGDVLLRSGRTRRRAAPRRR